MEYRVIIRMDFDVDVEANSIEEAEAKAMQVLRHEVDFENDAVEYERRVVESFKLLPKPGGA